jgi:hypothetical protein
MRGTRPRVEAVLFLVLLASGSMAYAAQNAPGSSCQDCRSVAAPSVPASLVEAAQCLPLEPGQWKLVTSPASSPQNRGWGSTGQTQFLVHHRLSHLRKPHPETGKPILDLEIPLRLVYRDEGGRNVPVPEDVDRKFREETNQCFDRASRWLRGPGGEHIRLRFAKTDASTEYRTVAIARPQQKIEGRGDAYFWNPDWDCSVRVHETLHLAGLMDEYVESQMGEIQDTSGRKLRDVFTAPEKLAPGEKFVPRFACRVPGPPKSVMGDHYTSLEHLDTHAEFRVCRCMGAQCQALLRSFEIDSSTPLVGCVGKGKALTREARPVLKFDVRLQQAFREGRPIVRDAADQPGAKEIVWMVPTQAPPPSDSNYSALWPGHFRVLTESAACNAKVREYHQCTAGALMSAPNGGRCPETPASCQGGSFDWLR